ncbi:MAG: hypothetical protein COU08_04365 [Candidatus Harrisonbacteria bacterium CG10_big_fil_rev_8_21_14_0_10_42_17]|uniref:Uncharacterized protein n=1 Tax=Candidatus Harrisonbacteria bacterium CG10_big_fil_rev_8_21_14_0_10_42_17 TaxID=1974584 RepID=A0A2M6WGY5_9BACT|nr:MAG: hypothetical protein COU08_04365 [Candidatus Harrisonbacteria bacterium CG10_big_fil_rev_8_21_14_0_10_42_17]
MADFSFAKFESISPSHNSNENDSEGRASEENEQETLLKQEITNEVARHANLSLRYEEFLLSQREDNSHLLNKEFERLKEEKLRSEERLQHLRSGAYAPGSEALSSPLPYEVYGLSVATSRVREELIKRLHDRFDNRLDFHNFNHSASGAHEVYELLHLIQEQDPGLVSNEDIEIAMLEMLAHDIDQDFDENSATRMRERRRGAYPEDIPHNDSGELKYEVGNERASAEELADELERYTYKVPSVEFARQHPHLLKNAGKKIFQISREEIVADIAVTYPEFDFSAELPDNSGRKGLKIYQPYLTPESSLRAFALAQVDLRSPLWGRTVAYHSNAELRELFIGISEDVRERGVDSLTYERRDNIATTVLMWIKNQIGFTVWQRELFLDNLEHNTLINASAHSEGIKQALRDRYLPNIDQSIIDAEQRYRRIKQDYNLAGDDPDSWGSSLTALDQDLDRFKALLQEVGYTFKK